jgi:transcription termination factor Rho
MSSVLNRKELAGSPLADLHQIASELGVEGYRGMRKDDLIGAILSAAGAPDEPADAEPAGDEPAAAEKPAAAEEPALAAEDDEDEDDTSEDTSEGTSEDTSEGTSEDEPDEVPAEEALERPARRGRRGRRAPAGEEEPEVVEDEVSDEEITSGVLDVLANGSGFVRVDPAGQPSPGDVYVSPAQIRRCELRAGDELSGPARSARRNERHPSLVRVETVNGSPAEPVEERPHFGDLTPVFPTHKLAGAKALKDAPFGRGSRVAVATAPGGDATPLLRELAVALAGDDDLGVQVVLVGALPEEVTEWRRQDGLPVSGGSFDRSADAQAQAAELAVERAKRRVERGGHAVVVIDSLEALPAGARRRIFGAGRATEEGGTLTVIASVGADRDALRWATTRVVLDADGKLSPESGTLRADSLS